MGENRRPLLASLRLAGFGKAFRALRNRGYRLYFYAFVANQMGFWLANLALQGVMVGLTDNDPSWVGRLFFALFSPALFFAPVAGVIADRVDRRRMLIVCYLSVASISAVLALLAHREMLDPYLTMALAFLCGVSFAFAGPASSAVAANIVEPDDLASAISLQSTANNLTRVMGPALAAPLIATGRYASSFVIFSAASVVAAGFIYAIRIPDYVRETGSARVWSRVWSGFLHASERYPAMYALVTAAVLSVFGVAHTALIPSFRGGGPRQPRGVSADLREHRCRGDDRCPCHRRRGSPGAASIDHAAVSLRDRPGDLRGVAHGGVGDDCGGGRRLLLLLGDDELADSGPGGGRRRRSGGG